MQYKARLDLSQNAIKYLDNKLNNLNESIKNATSNLK